MDFLSGFEREKGSDNDLLFCLNNWKNEVAIKKRKILQKHNWEKRPDVYQQVEFEMLLDFSIT